MKPTALYGSLAILGALLPFTVIVPWLMEHGLTVRLLLSELLANRVGAFFAMDVLLSAVTLFVFMRRESAWHRIPRSWVAVLATCLIGVSCGLPLFLFLRERALRANS